MYKTTSNFVNKQDSKHQYKWKKKKAYDPKYRIYGLKIYTPTENEKNSYSKSNFREIKFGKVVKN